MHLIVTGKAEYKAFGPFLQTIFPNVEFVAEFVSSFTSALL